MIVSIWKPSGPTSHDIIYEVRRITKEKRVGHAGTLDPLASGVLIVAIGRESTKKLSQFMVKDKEYLATIFLGQTSTTDDSEGEKKIVNDQKVPTRNEIEKTLKKFVGMVNQIPPAFSAIKLQGKKSYELARKGVAIELVARPVQIYAITINSYDYPNLVLKVHCGKGTYIRSLARDIGKALETGAYMSGLIRTRVGEFNKANSLSLEQFKTYWSSVTLAGVHSLQK